MNFDLESLIRPLDGYDKNMPGYEHRKGWNDAIRHVMDLHRVTAAPVNAVEPVAWVFFSNYGYEHFLKTRDQGYISDISVIPAFLERKSKEHDITVPLYAGPPTDTIGETP